MCGRFRLSRLEQWLLYLEALEADPSFAENWNAGYNIAPSQQVAVVSQRDTRTVVSSMRWGLIPSWAKEPSIGYKLINARAETVLEKHAFKNAFLQRRCLIPADGFYEWKKDGKKKQPYHFGMKDDSTFAFAGIWESWKSPEGKLVESCSVLTTAPNELVAEVHDRMPVILPVQHYKLWLFVPATEAARLLKFLEPFDPTEMCSYPVGLFVSNTKNEGPECIERIR